MSSPVYARVRLELNENLNEFHIYVFDPPDSKSPRTINMESDRKIIEPILWPHIRTAMECKTNRAVENALNDLANERFFTPPVQVMHQEEGQVDIRDRDIQSLIRLVKERILKKDYEASLLGQTAAIASAAYVKASNCAVM